MTRFSEPSTPRLNVTSLSQYVRLQNCDRFLRFRLCRDDERRLRQKWNITIQPLTPLLKESGLEFERQVGQQIAARGEHVVDLEREETQATIAWLRKAKDPVILLQANLEAPLGHYRVNGVADVIRLQQNRQGQLDVFIADVKASRKERMEHRLQVATYAYLLKGMADAEGIAIGAMRGGVLHIQDDGSIPTLNPDTPSFDLDTYLDILRRLAIDDDCTVNRIAHQPFEEVFYHLGYRCDGCMYNALCMYDSAERLDLSLVPYLSAVQKRALNAAGLETLRDLAELMNLPARGGQSREMTVASEHEDTVRILSNDWSVAPTLPVLVQRAKQALRRFDPSAEGASWIYNAGFGSLPSDEEHPSLVKIFFDAQHDYLRDRVFLISALVRGPTGEKVLVRCTDGPPTLESERDLLITWVGDVLAAIGAVSAGDSAPIHLYCYNRYDQRVLLDALKRHLEHVSLLPGFFDLMTQSPALSQPIISFLSTELEERNNLGMVCAPLHDAARALGFDWTDEDREYYRLFRARLFDNRRNMLRKSDGVLEAAPRDVPRDDPRWITIEAASRFNSQIPLEYAYGAWGQLPTDTEDDRVLEPFRQVTLRDLMAFARHRARALAHIEGSFRYKARFIDKPALSLASLRDGESQGPSLARSLEEFLFMEHHAALQAKLQIYSLPIERRVQTGLALLLRSEGYDRRRDVYHFAIEFEPLGLDPGQTMNAFRLKEGAWVVINAADQNVSATRVKSGRLATICGVGPDRIELKLLDVSFWGSRFRYRHDQNLTPEPDRLYTLDEMADDMNADKALAALQNADTNVLYQWMLSRPRQRSVPAGNHAFYERFADLINQIEPKTKLTTRQREAVAQRLEDPLFLVQGPPGTGKSQTLAWAVLARVAASIASGCPFRVAVSCKTHNAVNIVVGAIAAKLQRLMAFSTATVKALQDLQIYKVVNEETDEVPPHVEALQAYGYGAQRLESLLMHSLLVVGGTPGGLYNLAKYRSAGGRQVDWSLKTFDLVVIDEASQMSVPEGVLSCAFLRPEGNVIVVGDHRQMPPIIAHNWEEEEKRSATANRPHLSLFEFLVERDFPWVALDESFRLHTTIADFLQENVYVRDGIRFFSRRKEILTLPPTTSPLVDAVLNPRYPIVVIEHGEQSSQQYNETEVALVTPLIDICANSLRLDGKDGIGVVVPHRAQRAMLRDHFPYLAITDSIDTVERFQGGERDVIIVSATASDPDYVLAEADFLLNLNRLNVALSRPRKKLIVVASRSVIDLLTSDLDVFENAVIWKRLYYQYAAEVLWQGLLEGVDVRVRGKYAA